MSRKLFALTLGAFMVGALSGNVRAEEPALIQACGQGGCCRDHGCPQDGVCVPYTKTKQVEKRCYTDTCEQFCLPKCSLLGGLFGGGAYVATGGNRQTAETIWRSSLGGDYVVTPDMIAGKEPVHFSGPTTTSPAQPDMTVKPVTAP